MKEVIELLEEKDLFTPNNLLFIQIMLAAMSEDELVEEICAFAKFSLRSKPPLHIEAKARSSGW